jgi:hypothetical protein
MTESEREIEREKLFGYTHRLTDRSADRRTDREINGQDVL